MQRFFFTDSSIPITPPASSARRAPVRASTRDAAPVFHHGREMRPAIRSFRDAATEAQRTESPNLTESTPASRRAPRPGENSDAELVASYPPAHKRNPAGGSYNLVEDADGAHLFFLPSQSLGMGTTTANGTGVATADGHIMRPQDINPVIRAMNARNRATFAHTRTTTTDGLSERPVVNPVTGAIVARPIGFVK